MKCGPKTCRPIVDSCPSRSDCHAKMSAHRDKGREWGKPQRERQLRSTVTRVTVLTRVTGLGFRVWGLGFRVWGSGFRG
jgi:hypothetical protein